MFIMHLLCRRIGKLNYHLFQINFNHISSICSHFKISICRKILLFFLKWKRRQNSTHIWPLPLQVWNHWHRHWEGISKCLFSLQRGASFVCKQCLLISIRYDLYNCIVCVIREERKNLQIGSFFSMYCLKSLSSYLYSLQIVTKLRWTYNINSLYICYLSFNFFFFLKYL